MSLLPRKTRFGPQRRQGALAAPCLLLLLVVAAAARAEDSRPSLKHIRVGVHQSFTRIVLDMSAAVEWSVDQDPRGGLRVLIPGAVALPSATPLDVPRGPVRSVQALPRPAGIEVQIACREPGIQSRSLALEDPDRIVLDVSLAPLPPMEARRQAASSPSEASLAQRPATRPQAEQSAPAAPPPTPRGPQAPGRAPRPSPSPAPVPITVVLDPGHGGHDTGAVGPNGLVEKDVVLDLALRLARLLRERLGLRVLLTRTQDVFVPLPDRTAFANRAKADFLVSLHVNGAGKRGALGFETFFFSREPSDSDARASAQRENLPVESADRAESAQDALLRTTLADMAVTRDMKESSNLAEALLASLDTLLAVQNRGVKSGPFYVLATAAMPAVLVESAFITNPREERRLRRDAYRQRLAEALFDGISRYKARYERRLGLGPTAPPGAGS